MFGEPVAERLAERLAQPVADNLAVAVRLLLPPGAVGPAEVAAGAIAESWRLAELLRDDEDVILLCIALL